MIIDIRFKDSKSEGYIYTADFIPNIGETICIIKHNMDCIVVGVDHLVSGNMHGALRSKLVTVTVESI